MKARIGLMFASILAGSLLVAAMVVAQHQAQAPMNPPNPTNPPNPRNPDPLADVIFPPDLIMAHARQLKMSAEQKAFMRGEIQRTTGSFHDLQWKLQDQMENLHEILKATSVNEEEALAQLNRVLDVERDIKRLHVGLAVRIKNHLTPEQQEQLHVMRMGWHHGMPTPPGPAIRPME